MKLSGGKVRMGAVAAMGVAACAVVSFISRVQQSSAAGPISTYGDILIAGGCGSGFSSGAENSAVAVYVANSNNNSLTVSDISNPTGTPSATIIGSNSGLISPAKMTIDQAGTHLWVANPTGGQSGSGSITSYLTTDNGNVTPQTTIDGSLSGDINGSLNFPAGVAVDSAGQVYVANNGTNQLNSSVAVFASGASGAATPIVFLIGQFNSECTGAGTPFSCCTAAATGTCGLFNDSCLAANTPYECCTGPKTGTCVSGPELNRPSDIALDSTASPYVVNPPDNRITVYSPITGESGEITVPPIASIAGANTTLNQPQGIALDSSDNVYVTNKGSNTVLIFPARSNGNVPPVRTISGGGSGLNNPQGVAVDVNGQIYVTNFGNNTVTVYRAGLDNTAGSTPIVTISGGLSGLTGPNGIAVGVPSSLFLGSPDSVIFPLCPYSPIPNPSLDQPPEAGWTAGNFTHTLYNFELFEPSSGGFVATDSQGGIDGATMAFAPAGAAATLITTGPNSGRILISGGLDTYVPNNGATCINGQTYPNCYPNEVNATDIYNPANNSFVLGPFMNVPRWGHTSTDTLVGGRERIFIAGGGSNTAQTAFPPGGFYTVLNSTEVYDALTNTFAPAGQTPLMPTHQGFTRSGRIYHSATTIPSVPIGPNGGNVLLAGGCCDDFGNTWSTTDIYNPTPVLAAPYGTISEGPGMSYFRQSHSATVLTTGPMAGDIFIAGGYDIYDGNEITATELYDPSADAFFLGPYMNTPRADHIAEIIPVGSLAGDVLLTGGSAGKTSDIYNPTADTMTVGATMSELHAHAAGAIIPAGAFVNDILIAGGSLSVAQSELYVPPPALSPPTDVGAFIAGPQMNYGRYLTAAIALPAAALPTPTRTATGSPTVTLTVSSTPTATASPSATISPTPTATLSPTLTSTATPTAHVAPTPTITPTPTLSPTPTLGPTATLSPTISPSPTPTLTTTFTPTVAPTRTTTATPTITPTPVAAKLTVTPKSKNFGSITVGAQSGPVSVKVANKSQAHNAPVYMIDVESSPGYVITSNNCPVRPFFLATGHTCTVKVVCQPQTTGFFSGNLTISDNAANTPQIVSFSCTGK
ncbi:MAG TPA: hypothetical protein VMU16_15210 [Candidatus Binataceae bacterium]|nr:hypothetical protein [Candidatus Binataceae bacterium]